MHLVCFPVELKQGFNDDASYMVMGIVDPIYEEMFSLLFSFSKIKRWEKSWMQIFLLCVHIMLPCSGRPRYMAAEAAATRRSPIYL